MIENTKSFDPKNSCSFEKTPAAAGVDRIADKNPPKDISAMLRYECPLTEVSKEWLMQKAAEYRKSYEEMVLCYLSSDFFGHLLADWNDAELIFRNVIRDLDAHTTASDLCLNIDRIIREYEVMVTRAGTPIPDPIRLFAFVHEVVFYALSVPGYRAALEAELQTRFRPLLVRAVQDRILPKTARTVLDRANLSNAQFGRALKSREEEQQVSAARTEQQSCVKNDLLF